MPLSTQCNLVSVSKVNQLPIPKVFLTHCFAAFNLDYYTEVLDLSYLVDHLASDPFFKNYCRLNKKLVEVIEDYSLVSFVPLNVQVSMSSMPQATRSAESSFGRAGIQFL